MYFVALNLNLLSPGLSKIDFKETDFKNDSRKSAQQQMKMDLS
jgi:hypothetical protein